MSSQNGEKLVSIIIPTYKRPNELQKAVRSVLNQTYQNIEVIVVDDNSPDSTERKHTEDNMRVFLSDSRVKYIKHLKNLNGAVARNTGISHSRGKYVGFLDDDDEFLQTKIEKQITRLTQLDKSWGGCYCNYSIYKNDKIISQKKYSEEGDLSDSLLLIKNSLASGSTILLKREVLDELRGYDETFNRHQDWEFMLRFFKISKLAIVEDDLVKINYDSRINEPSVAEFIKTKELFINKFSTYINDSTNKNEILYKHYMDIIFWCAKKRSFKNLIKYLRISNIYKSIRFKDLVRLIYLITGLRGLYLPIVKRFNKIR